MNTKKNSKILALLLALAMVFVMSVPAFADTNNQVNVTVVFQQEGVELMSVPVTVTANSDRLYTVPNQTDDNSLIITQDRVSVIDATYKALSEVGCYDSTENALSWYREPLQNNDGTWYTKNWGGQINSMFATPNERLNSPTDMHWWKGNAWMYSTDGGITDNALFGTNVEVTDGMQIIWNYKYVEKNMD